jgi:hypothetical protein
MLLAGTSANYFSDKGHHLQKYLSHKMHKFNNYVEKKVHHKKTDANTEVAQIMQGIIETFGAKMSLEDILVCLVTEGEAAKMIESGVTALETAYHNKNMSGVADGVENILFGVKIAEGAIPVCTGTFPTDTWDYAGLLEANRILEDKSILQISPKDVLIHGASILDHVVKAEIHWEKKQYSKFGEQFGKILQLVTKKGQLSDKFSNEEFAKMSHGIMKSLSVGDFAVTDLETCFLSHGSAMQSTGIEEPLTQMLGQAIGESHGMEEWFLGVVASVSSVYYIRQNGCADMDLSSANWTDFDKMESTLKSLDDITMLKNIETNSIGLTRELVSIGADIAKKNVDDLGIQTGLVLKNVFVA